MSVRSKRRAVHVGVLLGGAEERGDAGDRVGDLAHQQLGLQRVGEPVHGTVEHVRWGVVGQLVEKLRRRASRDEERRELPAARTPWVVEPVGQIVLALRLLDRESASARSDREHRLFLDLEEQLQQLRVDLVVREHRQLAAHVEPPGP